MNIKKYKKIVLSIALLILVIFSSGSLLAQEYKEGLWVRTLFGIGLAGEEEISAKANFSGISSKIKSKANVALPYSWHATLSIGGVVVPHLVVHGGFDWQLLSRLKNAKTKTLKGKAIEQAGNYTSLTVGITYYIAPAANLYISPEFRTLLFSGIDGVSGGNGEHNEVTTRSNGLGYSLTIGKEWVMSSSYALGIALGYTRDSYTQTNETTQQSSTPMGTLMEIMSKTETSIKTNIVSLNFSSTFN